MNLSDYRYAQSDLHDLQAIEVADKNRHGFVFDKVLYEKKRLNYKDAERINPILHKPLKYSKQKEVRAAWKPNPNATVLNPKIVNCPFLLDHITKHAEK